MKWGPWMNRCMVATIMLLEATHCTTLTAAACQSLPLPSRSLPLARTPTAMHLRGGWWLGGEKPENDCCCASCVLSRSHRGSVKKSSAPAVPKSTAKDTAAGLERGRKLAEKWMRTLGYDANKLFPESNEGQGEMKEEEWQREEWERDERKRGGRGRDERKREEGERGEKERSEKERSEGKEGEGETRDARAERKERQRQERERADRERAERKEAEGRKEGSKKSKWCDEDAYPEWSEAVRSNLALHSAKREGKPEKLGKGKQAKTMKAAFLLEGGEQVNAVVKEIKRDRNCDFFLHNEYVSLARLNLAGGEEAPPEIPRVLAVFRDKAQVVVELFECKGDLYTQGHPKDLLVALHWWKMLARAVAFANRHLVFHCDVNPSNILVDEAGERLLLVDWACSRQEVSDSTKVTNARRGDYQPEEMMKGRVGPHTDVFGVAACLLWLIAGRTPKSKAISGEDGKARTPNSIAVILDPWLAGFAGAGGGLALGEILDKGLAEEVDDRVGSVDEMVEIVAGWEREHVRADV